MNDITSTTDQVTGMDMWGQCENGKPAGLLLRHANRAELQARLDAGEQLFVVGRRPRPR